MAVKAKSRRERVGSGLGLLLGILIFNLIAYQFVETKALSETNRMIGAIVSAQPKSGTPTFLTVA